MKRMLIAAVPVLCCLMFSGVAQAHATHGEGHRLRARSHGATAHRMARLRRREHCRHCSAGIVRRGSGGLVTLSTSRGLTYRVAASAAAAFNGFVHAVEAEGVKISSIGGWRPHGSVRGSLHPLGLAIDINQTARNATSGFMHHVGALASRFGLLSGCAFRHPDCGHVEVAGISGAYARAEGDSHEAFAAHRGASIARVALRRHGDRHVAEFRHRRMRLGSVRHWHARRASLQPSRLSADARPAVFWRS